MSIVCRLIDFSDDYLGSQDSWSQIATDTEAFGSIIFHAYLLIKMLGIP